MFSPFKRINNLLTTAGVVCCIRKPTLCSLDVASYVSVFVSQCACAHSFVVWPLSVINRRRDEHSALDVLDKKSYIVTDRAAPVARWRDSCSRWQWLICRSRVTTCTPISLRHCQCSACNHTILVLTLLGNFLQRKIYEINRSRTHDICQNTLQWS